MIRTTVLLFLLATLAAACGRSNPDPTPSPPPSATLTATVPPNTAPTPTPRPLPEVSGISTTPQWRPVDQLRPLSPAPASPFPAHDGESVVLYDTELGTVRNLGAGMYGTFTEDGRYMAWTDIAGDLWYLELPDGDPVKLGKGGSLLPAGGSLIAVDAGPGGTLWDLSTGTGTPGGVPGNGAFRDYQGAYFLVRDPTPQGLSFWVVSGMEPQFAPIPAAAARWAGPGEVIMATRPDGGLSNIYLVNVATVTAEPVATAGAIFNVVAVSGNDEWIAWTDNFCGGVIREGADGSTRVLDRSTGAVYDLGENIWPEGFTPDGRLRIGWGFGATALLDLGAWAYDVVLPEGPLRVHWSPDYRYGSRGLTFGHGGGCSY
jgi:hypothetical protein